MEVYLIVLVAVVAAFFVLKKIAGCMLKSVVFVVLIAVVLGGYMSKKLPTKEEHQSAMMKAVNELVDDEARAHGLGDNELTRLGKGTLASVVEAALSSRLELDNYYVFNTTHIRYKGKDKIVSVGVLGHVFTFDKDMLREALGNISLKDIETGF